MKQTVVVIPFVCVLALISFLVPAKEGFVERPVIDYGKAIRDVQLNEIYGTFKQVRLNTKKYHGHECQVTSFRKRVDDMFISNANLAAIDTKTMSKLDRIQFDASGKMLICDVDGSNCVTLGPVIVLVTDKVDVVIFYTSL
jgi:hypothetical protein